MKSFMCLGGLKIILGIEVIDFGRRVTVLYIFRGWLLYFAIILCVIDIEK